MKSTKVIKHNHEYNDCFKENKSFKIITKSVWKMQQTINCESY